jgi:hypothetical protein
LGSETELKDYFYLIVVTEEAMTKTGYEMERDDILESRQK